MEELALKDTVTNEALPSGTFFDLAILHILSTSTIESCECSSRVAGLKFVDSGRTLW